MMTDNKTVTDKKWLQDNKTENDTSGYNPWGGMLVL